LAYVIIQTNGYHPEGFSGGKGKGYKKIVPDINRRKKGGGNNARLGNGENYFVKYPSPGAAVNPGGGAAFSLVIDIT
jgi:hypothetical protein